MERITTQPGVRLGAVKRMRKPQRSSRAAVYRAVTGSVERPSCRGSVTSFFVGANQSLAPPLLLLTRGRQPTGRTPLYCSATMPVEFDLTGLHDEHTIRANVPPPLSELCVISKPALPGSIGPRRAHGAWPRR